MDDGLRYRPKFGFDIRIRPPKEERPPAHEHACDWPGCAEAGLHRAPKSREQLTEHSWYCLDHVREFNSHWDYFQGLTDDQVRAFQEASLTGHRPTWKFGTVGSDAGLELNRGQAKFQFHTFADPFGFFRGKRKPGPEAAPRQSLSVRQAKAFDAFNLEQGADRDAIRRRYTELVKRFHPDANGGDRGREERLREVIDAYHVLKSAGFC